MVKFSQNPDLER